MGHGGYGYNAAYDPATTKRGDAFEGRRPRYSWQNPGFAQTDAHPVVNVTWHDAVANVFDADSLVNWTKWQAFALPTADGFAVTAPVGQFTANAFGLHDMHGNV